MNDIASRSDIERLMNQFYAKLLKIDGMAAVFESIHFEEHLPKIIHFWSFVLLDEPGYKTNVFDKHLQLPIQSPQFDPACVLETYFQIVEETIYYLLL